MPHWPAQLPQSMPIEAPRGFVDPRVRTQMDAGPAKMRRRHTAVVRTFEVPADRFITDGVGLDALEAFWKTDLAEGSLPFEWSEPWAGAGVKTFRFVAPYQVTPIGAGRYRVGLSLEELP